MTADLLDSLRGLTREQIANLDPAVREQILRLAVPRIVEPYFPHAPHPPQALFLLDPRREAFYGGAAGGGKSDALLMAALQYALSMDTPIPTPTGWSTIADLRVGDRVFDEQGQPCSVVAKSPVYGTGDRYEIEFDDRSTITADGDHLWAADTFADRLGRGRGLVYPVRLVTTREMFRTQFTNHDRKDREPTHNWSIDVAAPLDLPDVDLPLDPYVLGAWLGDGSKRDGTMAGIDPEIADEFRAAGFTDIRPYGPHQWHVKGLRTAVSRLGIRNDKRVPEVYLRASYKQRLALLQGLMDTDGSVDGRWGIPRFANTDRGLIDAAKELIVSLGWKVREFEQTRKATHTIWALTFLADEPVFRLPRKAARQVVGRERVNARADKWRIIRSITRLDDDSTPVQCITVDSLSHLFLAGRAMVPTHNCDVPGYSAIIIRRTWSDLALPGAILRRAQEWLADTPAKSHEGGRWWSFPSGARLSFGYLQYPRDVDQYRSAEFQTIAFDELTTFTESSYLFLFSRLRRPALPCDQCSVRIVKVDPGERSTTRTGLLGDEVADRSGWVHNRAQPNYPLHCTRPMPDKRAMRQYPPSLMDGTTTIFDVPLRMRAASNPGGPGHVWTRDRFIAPGTKKRTASFYPAKLLDNPSLDQEAYAESLSHLGPVERARLLEGNWDIAEEGLIFKREWFEVIDPEEVPAPHKAIRYWDFAATKVKATGDRADPDWTAGALVCRVRGVYYILDVVRIRDDPFHVERTVANTASQDGKGVRVRLEQEPGSSGVIVVDHYRRNVLPGYNVDKLRPTLAKEERWRLWASAAGAGNVKLVRGDWIGAFLDEIAAAPYGPHDDMLDSVSGAVECLSQPEGRIIV